MSWTPPCPDRAPCTCLHLKTRSVSLAGSTAHVSGRKGYNTIFWFCIRRLSLELTLDVLTSCPLSDKLPHLCTLWPKARMANSIQRSWGRMWKWMQDVTLLTVLLCCNECPQNRERNFVRMCTHRDCPCVSQNVSCVTNMLPCEVIRTWAFHSTTYNDYQNELLQLHIQEHVTEMQLIWRKIFTKVHDARYNFSWGGGSH